MTVIEYNGQVHDNDLFSKDAFATEWVYQTDIDPGGQTPWTEFEKTLYSDAGDDKEFVLNAEYRCR